MEGKTTKKLFVLIFLTLVYGSLIFQGKLDSKTLMNVFCGSSLLMVAFQILAWKMKYTNFIHSVHEFDELSNKKSLNIFGERHEFSSAEDEKMERYLDTHGNLLVIVRKNIGIFLIIGLWLALFYYVLKADIQPSFNMLGGVAIFIVGANSYGHLLLPLFSQFLVILFFNKNYNYLFFLSFFIYTFLIFLSISSYSFQSDFVKKSLNKKIPKKGMEFFSNERYQAILGSVALLFLLIFSSNIIVPGNSDWLKRMLKPKSGIQQKKNKSDIKAGKKTRKVNKEAKNQEKKNEYSDYQRRKRDSDKVKGMERTLDKQKVDLENLKSLAKNIKNINAFENIDLSDSLNDYLEKLNQFEKKSNELQRKMKEQGHSRNISKEDLKKMMEDLKDLEKELENLKSSSEQLRPAKDDENPFLQKDFRELQDKQEGLEEQLQNLQKEVQSLQGQGKGPFQNSDEKGMVSGKSSPQGTQNGTDRVSGSGGSTENPTGQSSQKEGKQHQPAEKKKDKKEKKDFDWMKLLEKISTSLFVLVALFLLDKLSKLFRKKEITEDTDKKDKKDWGDRIRSVRRKNLSPEEEIIETYSVFHNFLNNKHYAPQGSEAPPAKIVYLENNENYKTIDKHFHLVTELFIQTRYAKKKVKPEELQAFRKCIKKMWKSL